MVEAFGVKSRLLEHRRALLAAAHAAELAAYAHGQGYRATDVDAYFEALAAESAAAHPHLATWRR